MNEYEELKQQYEELKQKIKDYERNERFKEQTDLASAQLRAMYDSMKEQGFDDDMASRILITILKGSMKNV